MKFILALALMLPAQSIYAASNTPEVLKNAEEVVTLTLEVGDVPFLKVCQNSSGLEVNLKDADDRPLFVSSVTVDAKNPGVEIEKVYEDKIGFFIRSAVSATTLATALKSGPVHDHIRVRTNNDKQLLIKVGLMTCPVGESRVRTVNLKTSALLSVAKATTPVVKEPTNLQKEASLMSADVAAKFDAAMKKHDEDEKLKRINARVQADFDEALKEEIQDK